MRKINVRKGKRYTFPTHVNEILLPREQAEIVEAFRVVIEPGKNTPAHVHDDAEQIYYVISGTGRGVLNHADGAAEEIEMLPEDLVHIPRNTEHQIFCTSRAESLIYLCVDGFPQGKPSNEPTWDSHAKAVMERLVKQE